MCIMTRALSIGQEHEVLEHLEDAGLDEKLAQTVIASKENRVAERWVALLKGVLNPVFMLRPHFDCEYGVITQDDQPKEGEFHVVISPFLTNPKLHHGGQRYLEAMLREPEKIPPDVDFEGARIFGIGTQIRVDQDNYVYPCLVKEGHWSLHFFSASEMALDDTTLILHINYDE